MSVKKTDSEQETNEKPKKSFLARIGGAANYDFCPNYNKYVYWLKKPIGWVVSCAAVSAMIGFFVGPQGFILMWTFLTLLLLGCIWPWLGMKGISAEILAERDRSKEGTPTTSVLRIRNRWPIPVFGLSVEGSFLQDAENDAEKIVLGLRRVAPFSDSEFRWNTIPQQRGLLPNGTPEIVTGFPFGIYRAAKEIEVHKPTTVWPDSTELSGNLFGDGSRFDVRGMLSDKSGNDGDTIGVREFRRGDRLRDIHWAQTARCGDLIVRERQTACQSPALVLVDLHPKSHVGTGSQNSYEWTIRVAASICQQLHQLNGYFEMHCVGSEDEHKSAFPNNNLGLTSVMDYLTHLPRLNEIEAGSPSVDLNNYLKPLLARFDKVVLIRTNANLTSISTQTEVVQIVLSLQAFDEDADYFAVPKETSKLSRSTSIIELNHADEIFTELQHQWKGVREHELRS